MLNLVFSPKRTPEALSEAVQLTIHRPKLYWQLAQKETLRLVRRPDPVDRSPVSGQGIM